MIGGESTRQARGLRSYSNVFLWTAIGLPLPTFFTHGIVRGEERVNPKRIQSNNVNELCVSALPSPTGEGSTWCCIQCDVPRQTDARSLPRLLQSIHTSYFAFFFQIFLVVITSTNTEWRSLCCPSPFGKRSCSVPTPRSTGGELASSRG